MKRHEDSKTTVGLFFVAIYCFLLTGPLPAQDMREAYERAVKHLPAQASKLVRNLTVEPVWLKSEDKFLYRRQLPNEAKEFLLVDAVANTVQRAFDHARLAQSLTQANKEEVDPTRLPFDRAELTENNLDFTWKGKPWRCSLPEYRCAPKTELADEVISPDGKWVVFLRDNDLYLRSIPNNREYSLSSDGQPYYGYGTTAEGINTVSDRRQGRARAPQVLWSPDSRRLLTYRLDERRVDPLYLIQAVPDQGWPEAGARRPILHSYRYALPGDENVPLRELVVFDIESRRKRTLQIPRLVELLPVRASQQLAIFNRRRALWGPDSRTVFASELSRDQKTLRLWSADAETGEAHLLIEEKAATYVDEGATLLGVRIILLPKRKQLLWWSERSGWGHLYLYSWDGTLIRALTSGDWLVRAVLQVNEDRNQVFLAGNARESGDPYLQRIYRVDLNSGELVLLTPEDQDHLVSPSGGTQLFSPSGSFFIDNYSRTDQAPVTVLRDATGKVLREIERADTSGYDALSAPRPHMFSAKARDGKTDIFGTLYLPSNLDAKRKYPILDSDYPGPQIIRAAKRYQAGSPEQALAELGFVVVQIDGLGTPFRSKAFHDFSYGNLGDAGGLEDHITALRQLVRQFPYLDLDRVGIFGHSGGGFASARALLMFPDFYKVGVSSAGSHDDLGYLFAWGEKYQGPVNGRNYDNQDTALLAKNLKGKLLLAWGDMDDNVHPALTIRLVDELIKVNKDFDLLVLPNRNHSFAIDPYFHRRRWDYFVKYLLGLEPPSGFVIPKVDDPPER